MTHGQLAAAWTAPLMAPRLLAAAAAAARGVSHSSAARPALGPGFFRVDPARLARVLAQSGVERRPQPPRATYLADLMGAWWRWIGGLVGRAVVGVPAWAVRGFAWVILLLALLLAGTAVWRSWRGRRHAAPRAAEAVLDAASVSAGAAGGEAAWGASAWRLERDRALAEGRLAEALRATWWWLARSLAGARVEPTWTGRDLLSASGRGELRGLVARLDALAYGPRHPGGPEAGGALRRLIGQLEEALG